MDADQLARDTSWIPRYAEPANTVAAALGDIPHLVRAAWEHALTFPELGGEGVEDLIADLKEIAARERERITTEARTVALRQAHAEVDHIAMEALRSAERKLTEGAAGIVAEGVADGIDPIGFFVYLLWEQRGDEKPIYVGQSVNLLSRLGNHMTDVAKRYRVHWITLIRCKDFRTMERTEDRLIKRYCPELNIAGIPPFSR